jgi:hypothetical protein
MPVLQQFAANRINWSEVRHRRRTTRSKTGQNIGQHIGQYIGQI